MKTLRYITNKLALVLTGVLLLSGMAACDDKDKSEPHDGNGCTG